MKSDTPEGKRILEEHVLVKKQYIEYFSRHKDLNLLANDIERLTFVTLRRFRALGQFPKYDVLDDDI